MDERKEAGSWAFQWNGRDKEDRDVPSGIYFYNLNMDDFVSTRKLIRIH
ncbi:T9SS type A sorting domain-containing protein [candidate division TA06 bacterium]|nr:T9SS type A sorting domain-containing protein [candidate division TA06 bacterium]